MPIRTTVWGENVHEQKNKDVAELYPKVMHGQIAALLNEDSNIKATTVTLQDAEHGMTEAKLDANITKTAPIITKQLTRLYGPDLAELMQQKAMAWRSMHTHAVIASCARVRTSCTSFHNTSNSSS